MLITTSVPAEPAPPPAPGYVVYEGVLPLPISEFDKAPSPPPEVLLAVLTPAQTQQEIVAHLEKLKQQYVTNLKQERYFLPEYLGFEKIFGKDIDIPCINDNVRFMSYNLDAVLKLDAINFFKGLTRYINVLAKNLMSFDILIIYIPS